MGPSHEFSTSGVPCLGEFERLAASLLPAAQIHFLQATGHWQLQTAPGQAASQDRITIHPHSEVIANLAHLKEEGVSRTTLLGVSPHCPPPWPPYPAGYEVSENGDHQSLLPDPLNTSFPITPVCYAQNPQRGKVHLHPSGFNPKSTLQGFPANSQGFGPPSAVFPGT